MITSTDSNMYREHHILERVYKVCFMVLLLEVNLQFIRVDIM